MRMIVDGQANPDIGATPRRVRLARPDDRDAMFALWERAVRATHDFLGESEIVALRAPVVHVLASDAVRWWVFEEGTTVAGFLGVVGNSVEALFVDPALHGRGVGKALVAHAQRLNEGEALVVDVNEANTGALRFYERLGFAVVGRSDHDDDGRPYPLLHMRRAMPAPDEEAPREERELT
jgi:putative acetyltransferase